MNSSIKFNLNDFKNAKEKLQNAYNEVNKQTPGDGPKQTLGQKIMVIVIFVVLIAISGFVLINNLDMFLLPADSVTFIVTDQNGEAIPDLRLYVSGPRSYTVDFDSIEERIYNVEPGEYSLRFSNFNLNYDCPTFLEDITMSEGDKLKIEYQCKKED